MEWWIDQGDPGPYVLPEDQYSDEYIALHSITYCSSMREWEELGLLGEERFVIFEDVPESHDEKIYHWKPNDPVWSNGIYCGTMHSIERHVEMPSAAFSFATNRVPPREFQTVTYNVITKLTRRELKELWNLSLSQPQHSMWQVSVSPATRLST